MKRLCGTVLGMEAVVVLLAIVPAKVLGHASGATAAAVCGAFAVVAIILAGAIGRGRWALYAGSALQVAMIAAGVLLPALYFLGVIFAALWVTGIWLARKWEGGATVLEQHSLTAAQPYSGTALRQRCVTAPVSSFVFP
jgi:hypothetical protein